MLQSMFGHRPKHKKFDYKFRYHDPDKEEREKRRIKIERPHKKHHQARSVILYALALAFVIWIITLL